MNTWLFIVNNRRFLAFGLMCTLGANVGQTFFIALFGDGVRTAFNLSHGEFGALYATATLASAAIIVWAGRRIDHVDLRLYAAVVTIGLALAAFAFGHAETPAMLAASLFGLRLFGQGLLRHTAVVSMARYFSATRGRAMSIVALGYPIGEAVLPTIAVAALLAVGWRETWIWIGVVLVVVHLPLAQWLLKGHGARHREHLESTKNDKDDRPVSTRDVLANQKFLMIMPAALMAPFILTGLFFHQVALAESKGWDLAWLAASFPAYAGATVVAGLASGWLMDRFGPGRLLMGFLIPLGLALVVVASATHPIAVPVYLALGGLSTGASGILITGIWAEVFGPAALGTVRALASMFTVIATAIAPAGLGWLLDGDVAFETVALGGLALVGLAAVVVQIPARSLVRRA